jgi:hypothetical protein
MTSEPYEVIMRALDSGSHRESALPELDRKPDPWESSMQATCECLSWRGALDNLARRHIEDELGETIYQNFPVRTRSLVVTAHTLLERQLITPEELDARMDTVRHRFRRE